MFVSLTREHHWPPSVLEGLFFDAEDYKGLFFWYEDLKQVHKELKNSRDKKK
jgi:hypothetical protein